MRTSPFPHRTASPFRRHASLQGFPFLSPRIPDPRPRTGLIDSPRSGRLPFSHPPLLWLAFHFRPPELDPATATSKQRQTLSLSPISEGETTRCCELFPFSPPPFFLVYEKPAVPTFFFFFVERRVMFHRHRKDHVLTSRKRRQHLFP